MSLRALVVGFTIVIMLLAFGAGAIQFNRGLSEYSQRTSALAVQVRGAALADSLARALAEEWAYVAGFANSVDPSQSAEQLQTAIDGYRDAGKISWAGLARTDGTVIAASEGVLVGQSVAQIPWFQRGLRGPFAGNVHEAMLLDPEANTPLRFVDFSLPLINTRGQVRGVFGVHINWEWVQSLVSEMADSLDVDAFLVDRSGEILLATDPQITSDVARSLASFRAANLVRSASFVEAWPDGVDYYSFVVPDVGFADVPSFGWALVLRLDSAPISGAQSQFARFMLMGGGLVALAAILAMALVFGVLLRPLNSLIDAISRLSKGEDVGFVAGSMHYREAARLTNALARFQTKDADRRQLRRPGSEPPQ